MEQATLKILAATQTNAALNDIKLINQTTPWNWNYGVVLIQAKSDNYKVEKTETQSIKFVCNLLKHLEG